jgi:shikimate dehydrogenase
MIKAAVLGSPISHSLSPKIHMKAYELLGIAGDYVAIELGEESLRTFFEENKDSSWTGFSLTMPLKEVVLEVCQNVSAIATRCNSANTLYKREDIWTATSTDYLAFENLLKVASNSKIAIIGGGGTARAAAGALDSKVSNLDIILRNPEREEALRAAAPNTRISFLRESAPIERYDFVIQTLPSGAYDLNSKNLLRTEGTLLECLYRPWPTQIASRFLELGGKVISGQELLVEQALFQIKLFSQIEFDFDTMRKSLLEYLAI